MSSELTEAELALRTAFELMQAGEEAKALDVIMQSVHAQRATATEADFDGAQLARTLNHAGVLHANMEKHEEAVSLHEEALQLQRKALPVGHVEVGLTLQRLAAELHTAGGDQLPRAHACYTEALQLIKAHHEAGGDPKATAVELANTYAGLGGVCNNMFKYNAAVDHFEHALLLLADVAGADSPAYTNLEETAKYCRGMMKQQGQFPISDCQARGGNPAAKLCSGCKEARYCSKECQAKHWKKHKKLCRVGKAAKA